MKPFKVHRCDKAMRTQARALKQAAKAQEARA